MLHSAGKLFLSLLVVLTSCATVRPLSHNREHNAEQLAARIQGSNYSGTAFKYRGHLVTAGHICAHHLATDDAPLRIYYSADGQEYFGGYFLPVAVAFDGASDACVLQAVGPSVALPLDNLAPGDSPAVDDPVSIVGAPYGLMLFRTEGFVANLDMRGYIAVSAPAAPGNSGSPVIDATGRVVGMLNAGVPAYEHISLVSPHAVLDRLIDGPAAN